MVWPICRQLHAAGIKIAPSTYYARLNHTPSTREKRNRVLINYLIWLFEKNFYVYGARKLHAVINQPSHLEDHGQGPVARCTVERLMRIAKIKRPGQEEEPEYHVFRAEGFLSAGSGGPQVHRYPPESTMGR